MKNTPFSFTSESVSEGHPDKVADQISDAILDLYLAHDPFSKVAVETMITHQNVIVAGEIKSTAELMGKIPDTVKSVIKDIGYIDKSLGFDYKDFQFQNLIHKQSKNINYSVEKGGAGDQGLMFGYACRETPEFMPMPIMLAHKLVHQQSSVRKNRILPWLGPDAKSQVTVEYVDGNPNSVKKIVLSSQHDPSITNHEIKKAITDYIITPVIPSHMINSDTQILINPSGRFEIGGPQADTGVTGRKIIVDTYGGSCPHGGGAFSGKDATKVDRSGAYMARFLAKNVVSKNIADRCTIQLSYAIGKANPVSLMVDFHGTGYKKEKEIEQSILENIDLTPSGIIDSLNLRTTNYKNTAAYGHFGNVKTNFPWEAVPKYFLC